MFEDREKLEARVKRLESELEDAEMELEDAECEVRTLREQVKRLDAYEDAIASISAQITRVRAACVHLVDCQWNIELQSTRGGRAHIPEDIKFGIIQADLDLEWDRLRELIAEAQNV